MLISREGFGLGSHPRAAQVPNQAPRLFEHNRNVWAGWLSQRQALPISLMELAICASS